MAQERNTYKTTATGSALTVDQGQIVSSGYNHPFQTHFDSENQPPLTRGEKMFNAFDWYGIGWIVNAALGVAMANKLSHGSWQPVFNTFNEKLGQEWFTKEAFATMGGGAGAPAVGAARSITTLGALMTGGYACMLPIKIIHDYKKPIVTTLDNWFGPSNPTDSQQKMIEARHAYLDHEPHVSLWNAFSGRTTTMAMILGAHYTLGQPQIARMINPETTFKGFEHQFTRFGHASYDMVKATEKGAKWIKAVEDGLGKTTSELTDRFAKSSADHYVPIEKTEHLRKLFSLGYEDIFFSFWGATGTMLFSKAFAHKEDKAARPASHITERSHERTLRDAPQAQMGHS